MTAAIAGVGPAGPYRAIKTNYRILTKQHKELTCRDDLEATPGMAYVRALNGVSLITGYFVRSRHIQPRQQLDEWPGN